MRSKLLTAVLIALLTTLLLVLCAVPAVADVVFADRVLVRLPRKG